MESAQFLKIPRNIAGISYKDMRLYVRFLDLKAQNPDAGEFRIYHSNRTYQRDIKKMISKGWVTREGCRIKLKAYQHVWRSLGIEQQTVKGIRSFRYWKMSIENLPLQRKEYLKEIQDWIHRKIAERKTKQIRYAGNKRRTRGALKETGCKIDQATFSATSSAVLFGYKSTATGSKLRQKYFSLIPQAEDEKKQYWNEAKGRYQNHCRKIAL